MSSPADGKRPRRGPQGPAVKGGGREAATLRDAMTRVEAENARLQALVRASQRAIGLPASRANPKQGAKETAGTNGSKKRRRRRTVARALKAARRITRETPEPTPPQSPAGEGSEG